MKKRIVNGLMWNSISTHTTTALRFLGLIILARILSSEDFGIVAYISGVFIIFSTLLGWGVEHYIIKTVKNIKRAVRVTYSVQLIGVAVLVALFALVYPFLFELEFLWFFIIIGLAKVLRLLFSPFSGLMLKRMQFKKFSYITIVSEVITFLVALAGLFYDLGLMLLVIYTALPEFIQGICYYFSAEKEYKKVGFTKEEFKEFFKFGKYLLVALFCDKVYRQSDYVVIQKAVGSNALGFYSQAYKLNELFSNITIGAIGTVASAAFGELQKKKEALQKSYFVLCAFTMRLIVLIYVPFILLLPQAITLLFGAKWLPMIPIVQITSIYAVLSPYRRINRMFQKSIGNTKPVLQSHFVELLFFLVVLIPGVYFYGTIGAAVAVNVGIIAGLVVIMNSVKNIVGLQLKKVFLPPIISGVVASMIFLFLPIPTMPLLWDLAVNGSIIVALIVLLHVIMEKDSISLIFREIPVLSKFSKYL